jgi:hypothetical protein
MVRTSHFLATSAVIADALPLVVPMPMQTKATRTPKFQTIEHVYLVALARLVGSPRGSGRIGEEPANFMARDVIAAGPLPAIMILLRPKF